MFLLLACSGSPDSGDSDANTPPHVTILSPSSEVIRGSFVVQGDAWDAHSAPDMLWVRLDPSPSGGSGFGSYQQVNADGSWSMTLPSQPAGHLSMQAEVVDPEGLTDIDYAGAWVDDPDAPLVTIQNPLEGAAVLEGSSLVMEADILDNLGEPWELSWKLTGPYTAALSCDGSSGSPATCAWTAEIGSWTLLVDAAASDGLSGRALVAFDVVIAAAYDDDGDGFSEEEGDCDDQNGGVGRPLVYYPDADGDGFGEEGKEQESCTAQSGYTTFGGDCDDQKPLIYPGADEYCNSMDDNCDGKVDEDPVDAIDWFLDGDGDGEGAGVGTHACSLAGATSSSTDCDDSNAFIYTGAAEYCDGIDHDCDGSVNDADALDAPLWYLDADGDGEGDPGSTWSACSLPTGYVAGGGDCNDNDAAICPGMDEYCNGLDDDCDGTADEADALDATLWYLDADGDGVGVPTQVQTACYLPLGFSSSDEDCNDQDSTINPLVQEVCDGIDSNCDGKADTDLAHFWYPDVDGDGYGGTGPTQSCTQPSSTVAIGGDCDEDDSRVHPNAPETCDARDEDCDSLIDDNANDQKIWYEDADGDGYGNPLVPEIACDQPANAAANDDDCNDTNSNVNPGQLELCDSHDNDCDGSVDENTTTLATYYLDSDGDGWGVSTSTRSSCFPPTGYASMYDDCDETNPDINPGEVESCDGIDNNCNGVTDTDTPNIAIWSPDADQDGFGSAVETPACSQPAGNYVRTDPNARDCDDGDASVYPGATEWCDMLDQDCDNDTFDEDAQDAQVYYADADGDGYGDPAQYRRICPGVLPSGWVSGGGDCDDQNAAVNRGEFEVCDLSGTDEDCDGLDDNNDPQGATGKITYYRDADGDGYGVSTLTMSSCETPAGYTLQTGDCNAGNSAINPGASEVCNGTDDDCDGAINEDMRDGQEPNDSSSATSLGTIDNGYQELEVTFHLSSDQDWLNWSMTDSASTPINLTIHIDNPSAIPIIAILKNNNYLNNSATSAYHGSDASIDLVIPTSLAYDNERSWSLRLLPATNNGWSISTCDLPITVRIEEN